jgi:hypothetical protein
MALGVLRYWRIPEPAAFSSDRPSLQNPILKVSSSPLAPSVAQSSARLLGPYWDIWRGENPALLAFNSLESGIWILYPVKPQSPMAQMVPRLSRL